MIVLSYLDLPPTSNHAYKSFVTGGKIRHAASNKLVVYKRLFANYCLMNREVIDEARKQVEEWKREKLRLTIHTDFYFNRAQIFTKDGAVKKCDVSNRIKAIHDLVCEALWMDDSVFFRISAEKKLTEREPHATVEIYTLGPSDERV